MQFPSPPHFWHCQKPTAVARCHRREPTVFISINFKRLVASRGLFAAAAATGDHQLALLPLRVHFISRQKKLIRYASAVTVACLVLVTSPSSGCCVVIWAIFFPGGKLQQLIFRQLQLQSKKFHQSPLTATVNLICSHFAPTLCSVSFAHTRKLHKKRAMVALEIEIFDLIRKKWKRRFLLAATCVLRSSAAFTWTFGWKRAFYI